MDIPSWLLVVTASVFIFITALIRTPSSPHPNMRTKSVVFFALVFATSLVPSFIHTMQVSRRSNSVAESTGSTPLAALSSVGLSCLLIFACLYFFLCAPGRLRLHYGFVVIALVPWTMAMLVTVIHGDYIGYTSFLYPCVVLATQAIRGEIFELRYIGYFTFFVASLSILMGVLIPSKGLLHGASGQLSYADKAILGDFLLAGPYKHSNVLAVMLALGLPWILLIGRRPYVIVAMCVTALALLWTGSRTALVAAAAGILFYWILRAVRVSRFRLILTYVSAASAGLAILWVPLIVSSPAAFSSRGRIWLGSRETWGTNEMAGNGYGWYGYIANFHNDLIEIAFNGHNLFVHLMTTGGILYTFGVIVIVAIAVRNASRWAAADVLAPAVFILTFLIASILEVTYRFRDIEVYFPIAAIPLIFLCLRSPACSKREFAAHPETYQGGDPRLTSVT